MTAPDPITGETARRLAEQELSRPEYRQGGDSWVDRVLDAINRFFSSLFGGAGQGTTVALTIVVVVLLAIVVAAAVRAGRLPGRRRREAAAVGDPLASEAGVDHAARAAAYAARGDHAAAVREYLRAAIADLEARGLLTARPGRTGAAAAHEGGLALPAARDPLVAGARAFDETWFGARPATAADVDAARGAFEAVRRPAAALIDRGGG